MHERSIEQKNNYFRELTRNLRHAGFAVGDEADGLLPVKLDGQQFCSAMSGGSIRYCREDISSECLKAALERVTDIARITDEYMSQLETAPFLRVGSQEDRYRLLSDFNGIVLAGCQTKYGAQFVTWERSPDRSSLNHGHYYGPDSGIAGYTAAKQDFTARSGLIPDSALFTREQMVGIFYCVQDAVDNDDIKDVPALSIIFPIVSSAFLICSFSFKIPICRFVHRLCVCASGSVMISPRPVC